MKQLSLLISVLLFIFCSGCVTQSIPQNDSSILHSQADTPIRTAFDDSHELDPDIPCLLAHVSVNRIWDGIYAIDDYPDSIPIYVVADCTIDHVFFIGASPALPPNTPFVSEGTSCTVWFSLSDEVTADTKKGICYQFLNSFDSFILYAYEGTPYYWSDSLLRNRVATECGILDDPLDSTLVVSPAIIVDDFLSWQIIPFKDGHIDTRIMQDFVTDLYDNQYTMRFSLETTDSLRGQTFTNGSTVEETYIALNKYVNDFSTRKESIS